ncbi:MAG: PDZ domain-containing protein [Tenericutes bacterium]|jgi:serine protease Do|nr:PDZ domain-containing protein [Mycoplasmatota bacterium]
MKKRNLYFVITIITLFTSIFGTYYIFDNQTEKPSYNKETIIMEESGITSGIKKIYNAVVLIENYQGDNIIATGTGFIYKKDDKTGYILTNHHVISDGNKIKIILADDKEVEANYVGSDEYLDLAVLTIDSKYVLQVAEMGNSNNVELGETVFTVGSPVGYEYRGTVTRGILSGKDRMVSVRVLSSSEDWVMKVLQTDAAINPGNSGGPLLNVAGEVIGINSLKFSDTSIEGMGFAIPIEFALAHIDNLENGKKIERPLLGVNMINANSPDFVFNKYALESNSDNIVGVIVVDVVDNSPAHKVGLKKNDIIIKIAGEKIKDTATLRYELYKYSPGDSIEITYIRSGKTKTVKVILTKGE